MSPTTTPPPVSNESGAFDLPSILVGVVVVGVLTAGVLGSVFGVIPFSQDNSAKQDLSAIKTAEGVARTQHGGYATKDGLAALKLVSPLPDSTQVFANSAGFCAATVSQTGHVFSITSASDVAEGSSCGTAGTVGGTDGGTTGKTVSLSDPWVIPDPALRAAVVKEVTAGGTVSPASYTTSAATGATLTMVRASYTTSIAAAAAAAVPADVTAPAEYQLTMGDATKLTHLDASGLGITTLEGMQYADNIVTLDVSDNKIPDVGPISGKAALTDLNIAGNPVTVLDPLAGNGALATLNISDTQVSNLAPVAGLPLTGITMNNVPVTDVGVLSGMGSLTTVTANGTAVPDWSPANHVPTVIAPWVILDTPMMNGIHSSKWWAPPTTIADARKMEGFDVTPSIRNGAVDFSAFKVMTNAWLIFSPANQDEMNKIGLLPHVKELTLGSDVSDLSVLDSAPSTSQIESIDGYYSSVTNLSPLAHATSLKKLKAPWLTSDLSPLAGLTNMEDLDLNIVPATDLEPLSGLTKMKYLKVNPAANDFKFLSGLHDLVKVDLGTNRHISDVGPFAGLSNLEYLYLSQTPIAANYASADWTPVAHVRYVTSRPANFGMTSDQLATDWVIPDTALRNAIADNLGKPHDAPLTHGDACSLYTLTLPVEATSLEGLQYAKGLDQLTVSHTSVTDLSPLKDLPLRWLWATDTHITDWAPVAYVPNLVGKP